MQPTPRRLASWIFATLFATVATYHFFVLLDAEMPRAIVLRHLVFCVVDTAFAALIWFWPRWLLIPVGVLTVEQFHAHAGHDWHLWHDSRQIAWFGLFTLSAQVVLCFLIVVDMVKRRRV
ncbi:MAG TPA: hypothetical protein VNU94_02580 [Acidobacteriaceae bacterium]|jgi:hypothetical protein|nr:hypothetical protein [Acidobacteriaceae bacterium]